MSLFLTPDELYELTGYRMPKRIIQDRLQHRSAAMVSTVYDRKPAEVTVLKTSHEP